MQEGRLYDYWQAAEITGYSAETIRAYCERGFFTAAPRLHRKAIPLRDPRPVLPPADRNRYRGARDAAGLRG
jgi:hypothetical protein